MMSVQDAAAMVKGQAGGGNPVFTGVSTDTRSVRSGELFVALRGERFDGHAFLDQATKAGAAAAMVDRNHQGTPPVPAIVVDDTKLALGALARGWRARFSPALIAITGSNGKTTVKEMLASILRRHAGEDAVLATAGNLNNDIGLPLTLLKLEARHRCCAIELGMNHKGEIAYLADIAAPTVALVNNAQREHLEFMKSVEDVAAENASVYAALPAQGVAVVNADDAHADFFRKAAGKRRVVDFGLEKKALVSGGYALKALQSEIEILTPAGEARATLAIPGLHNVRNALAAAACAFAVGITEKIIAEGLSAFRPYTGRLQVKSAVSGATVIDDTYNANPDSVRAAIDVLAACPAPTVLVLGDMGEVGGQGAEFHREVGAYARARKITSLLALGEASRHAVEAFGSGGRHFDSLESLLLGIQGRSILVKGSRFMRMERVVAALTGSASGGH
ncbi:MAG: UDP-N-acetylmuramoyl-tripeptide--D-alanyl-D-alanine ligase [Betaproteobacteria bacterium]|jgi:UDP-N-acetylmuramoyl-tripeptide--D-alanyl-D-alanine ligase|nr:UDP-N-acetylmuramoyl-tripeptide--D-alanyl-D-alanine ligase [Betaproteobacteria bacterium]